MITPMKAIRAKCIDCCAGQRQEVKACTIQKCPLFPYKSGHRPKVDKYTTDDVETEKPPENMVVNEESGDSD